MKLTRLMIFVALTAFAAVSMGQYASSTVSTVVPIIGISLTPAATAANPKPASVGAIQAGDTIELPNGLKLVVDAHTRVLPGTHLKVSRDGKDMGDVTVPALKPAVDFGLFAAAFSIAGPIPQSNGSFLGGTKTVWGQIVSADYHLKPKKPTQSLGIGGWYFHPDKPKYNNLYQVHARFFAKPGFGVQAAYINSTQYSAPSITVHALIDLDSSTYDPNGKRPWSVEFGIGFLNNLSNVVSVETGATTQSHTINVSAFTQASVQVKKGIFLTSSLWFIRDRNLDVTRLGVGLESKF